MNHPYIYAHTHKNSLLNELVDNICHFLDLAIITHTGIFNSSSSDSNLIFIKSFS